MSGAAHGAGGGGVGGEGHGGGMVGEGQPPSQPAGVRGGLLLEANLGSGGKGDEGYPARQEGVF